jgi:hypothetical protein
MEDAEPANPELAIALPLGALAGRLARVESDLRRLEVKSLASATGDGNGRRHDQIAARVEEILLTLDRIGILMADIEADLRAGAKTSSVTECRRAGLRKPLPEWDD